MGTTRRNFLKTSALVDSGLRFARASSLREGIAWSAAQVASLSSDIVWLQSETVTLADGSTTQALVPHLLVRRLDAASALATLLPFWVALSVVLPAACTLLPCTARPCSIRSAPLQQAINALRALLRFELLFAAPCVPCAVA